MWQSKKNTDGSWTEWDTRSPVDVDKADGQVRVLNVCPNSESMTYLQNWMNIKATDYDGTETTVSRGIIHVYPVLISEFNINPEKILKTDPITHELTVEYQYSVIMFGTYDANAKQDLTATSRDETIKFAYAGGGLLFGHDTVAYPGVSSVGDRSYFKRFAEPEL